MLKIGLLSFFWLSFSVQLDPCPPDKLAVYKVILHTFWSRDKFPKHYPDWRPAAQWSKLVGRSHDSSYVLYRIGRNASNGVRDFVENNLIDNLEEQDSNHKGILDEFIGASIQSGVGRTETEFIVDGNHSKVSIMSRIIPSPDWFIGIDSFDLCLNGNWLDSITFQLDPLDAGTDNGFTFTAQNWVTEPQGVIYRIRSRYPSHPAGSFYYPDKNKLPTIATAQFIKLKEYGLVQTFNHAQDNKHYEIVTDLENERKDNSLNVYYGGNNNDFQLAIEEEREELNPYHSNVVTHIYNRSVSTKSPKIPKFMKPSKTIKNGDKNQIVHNVNESNLFPQSYNGNMTGTLRRPFGRKKSNKKYRIPKDCKVSDWSEWSPCSKSCGIGETIRRRKIIKRERRGGKLCPPVKETKWCGSWISCSKNL